jgi:hypothetical protein
MCKLRNNNLSYKIMKFNKLITKSSIAILTSLFAVQSFADPIYENVGGVSYKITLSPLTTMDAIESTLKTSPIYGNETLSESLTYAVNTRLGLPNTTAATGTDIWWAAASGPLFVFDIYSCPSAPTGKCSQWNSWYGSAGWGGGFNTNDNYYLALVTYRVSATDTQSSLARLASNLRSSYNSASLISNFPNSNTYDCNLFDVKGMCISAGGRYSTVDNPSSNSTAAVVTLGYKVSPSIRIGGFLDQSVNNNNPTGINLSNKNPMMGAFAYWNQNADGLGYQVKIANAYQDKDLTTTRDVIGTSEAGTGKTSLNSRSYVGELSYAFMLKENTLVRPYFALRHTTIEQDAYTETGVDTPLTYSAINNRTTSALMGVKFKHALTPKANLTGSLGLEQDLHNKTDRLTATGIAGLTSENLSSDLHRTRPVASIGATYDIAKTQRLSGEVLVQQLPFQSTAGATSLMSIT